ncbi:MAG: antibiotic biosynthesis monooxygenase [Thermoanaerobaculia bacterium]|nr:antibiotic biosynthesis monooxygenase [Thermoanaerobaculia bacterium]
MFLRVLRANLREGALWGFREYYESRVIPTLAETDGCLFAALLRPTAESVQDTCDSLTLWESAAHADAYIDSGRYDELLDGADPFLSAATEWKADLTKLGADERPPLPDPAVETFPVEVARHAPGAADSGALFLRIVDHRVEPARFDDLKRTYEENVAPRLLETPGCLATYLVEGLKGKSQALSVTFWADEASAVRYEASGQFDALAALLQPFLSGIYQWRLSLTPAGEGRDLKGTDLKVTTFHVVAGKRLRSPGG